ncbi:hypothetical protein Bca4012_102907 [Brassica carinata]
MLLRDPKDGELCLSGRPEETLVEARSDTDANRSPDLELAMRDEPKPGYGAQLRANLEPTKGVGRLRQQDGGHGSRNPLRIDPKSRETRLIALMRELQRGSVKIPNRTWRLTATLPTLETAQPEVGSSGWKSTARRVVSVHSRALENPEDRKPPRPVALITASGLQGEQPLFNPPTVGGLLEPLTWRATASCRPGTDWERLFRAFRRRTANSELCSECQSEEIQPSAVNGGVTMTLLRCPKMSSTRTEISWEQKGKSSLDSDFQYEYEPQAAHSDAAFDPSMSALPIIVKQNSPSVGLFTHQ